MIKTWLEKGEEAGNKHSPFFFCNVFKTSANSVSLKLGNV